MDTVGALGKEVVLEWRRSEVGVYNMTRLIVVLGDPLGELHGVGNGSGEEDVANLVGKENDGLFPHDTTSCDRLDMVVCGNTVRHLQGSRM